MTTSTSPSTPSPSVTGASLSFKPKAPAVTTPADPTGIVTIGDRKFKVTIEIQIEGVWKKIDPAKFDTVEKFILQNLVNKCHGIYTSVTKDKGRPRLITVHFQNNHTTESILSKTIGKVFKRFKEDIVPVDFKKLEYQTTDADATEVFDPALEELEDSSVSDIRVHLKELAPFTQHVYKNSRHLTSKDKRPVDPVSKTIDESIKDAGAVGNLCAALSLAKIELDKHSPEDIVRKYGLDAAVTAQLRSASSEEQIVLLANHLVEKAAEIIEMSVFFRDDTIHDQTKPCLDAVTTALRAMGEDDTGTPEEIVKRYAALIRNPGTMLDLPFFLALGGPFIIVHKPHPSAPNQIMVIGRDFRIREKIEDLDFNDVNILFFNSQVHYQAIILDDDEKVAAMQQLIRRDIDAQIKDLVARLQNKDIAEEAVERDVADAIALFRLYPQVEQELIRELQAQYPDKLTDAKLANIRAAPNRRDFILRLRVAIQE